ncbi:MAG: 4-hydroxy-tetrahydrodipicolinate synthase [Mucilaginibacter polytrichastri]|nr:4-hydroxy-tetrahydrodipicolinate synthase [Mucilaginibacter polytrichastri]
MDILNGSGVAIITPFSPSGQIDFPALGKLIEHLISNGIDYLVVLGTTGESATLTADERKSVFAYVAEKVNGRVPLVAGHGGNDTAALSREIREFDTSGYSAILSASPHYNKPNQEGIFQHYQAIAETSPLPILLYNVPGRTGGNILPETTVRLAHAFSNIVATKEASGVFDQFSRIMRDKPEHFKLISGDDPVTLPMMALGASGVISVVGNALPRQVSDLVKACAAGDYGKGNALHQRLLEFTRLLFADGSPAGVKAALNHLGVCDEHVRLPLTAVNASVRAAIIHELGQFA